MMSSQMNSGLQHRVPVNLRATHHVLQFTHYILPRRQLEGVMPINLFNNAIWQHQKWDRIRAEGFKGPIGHQSQLIEQGAVKNRTKARLTLKCDHLVERDRLTYFDAEPFQQGGVHIDAPEPMFNRPLRPLIPRPSAELDSAESILERLNGLEKTSELAPALPVVSNIGDPVRP